MEVLCRRGEVPIEPPLLGIVGFIEVGLFWAAGRAGSAAGAGSQDGDGEGVGGQKVISLDFGRSFSEAF